MVSKHLATSLAVIPSLCKARFLEAITEANAERNQCITGFRKTWQAHTFYLLSNCGYSQMKRKTFFLKF